MNVPDAPTRTAAAGTSAEASRTDKYLTHLARVHGYGKGDISLASREEAQEINRLAGSAARLAFACF